MPFTPCSMQHALSVHDQTNPFHFCKYLPVIHRGMCCHTQGFWPDGLYTAPTEEAMVSDLHLAKALGFNMLRKHVKVEPDRWYYHADRLGILVWQVRCRVIPAPHES